MLWVRIQTQRKEENVKKEAVWDINGIHENSLLKNPTIKIQTVKITFESKSRRIIKSCCKFLGQKKLKNVSTICEKQR